MLNWASGIALRKLIQKLSAARWALRPLGRWDIPIERPDRIRTEFDEMRHPSSQSDAEQDDDRGGCWLPRS